MKRIALLLAGAVLGSGCVVESTCDPESLTVDWRFIDANGTGNLLCSDVPGVIDSVDVFVDGTLWDTVPCTNYGVTLFNVGSGFHRVSVEGYDGTTFVNRDWADVNVDSCGDTLFQANPGEQWLEVAPAGCSVNNGYLIYSILDYTRTGSTAVVFDEILSSSAAITTYRCDSGIFYLSTVPYGDYVLDGIEEVNATATTLYSSHCATVDLLTDFNTVTTSPPDTTTYPVLMSTSGLTCGL